MPDPRRRRPPRGRLAFAGLLGLAAGLGQAPVSLPWITLLALAAACHLFLRARRTATAAWLGWAFGTGYFAATLFWIVEPFFVDPARHGWMAPFALVGMAGGLALFWAVGWAAAQRLAPRDRLRRALLWVLAMAAAEATRGTVLTGFPWALIGHVWIGWGPMQLAAFVGPVGLTLLTLLLPAVAAALWRKRRLAAVALALPFAGLYAIGAWQAGLPVPEPADPARLRIVQPNAAQHLKWDPAMAVIFYERQLDLTARTGPEGRPDLVIWPETALPTLLGNAAPALAEIAAAGDGAQVVLGLQRLDRARAFNSLVLLDRQGAVDTVYDKHHLVPFGEYLPFGGLLARIGLAAFTAQQGFGYSAGPGAALVEIDGVGTALPLICYEAIFPRDLRAAPGRADFILQITNDAWFGRISGPFQHLAQARLRAVEMGLPFVRSANTGVSAVIDARGRVLDALPLNTPGALDADLPGALPPTLYARTGDGPVILVLIVAAMALTLTGWRKSVDGGQPRA